MKRSRGLSLDLSSRHAHSDDFHYRISADRRNANRFYRRRFDDRFFIDDSKEYASPSFRFKLHRFMFAGRRAIITEAIHAFLNAVWCVLYVLETYYSGDELPGWHVPVDYAFVSLLLALFFLYLYTSHRRLKFLLSLYAFIDYITIILGFVSIQWIPELRPTAMLRIFRVTRFVNVISNRRWKSGAKIIGILISFLFIATCTLIIFEEHTLHNFHTAFYFVVVTASTVGFGDLGPDTDVGRYLTVITIITAVILIPILGYHFSRLLFASEDQYMGKFKRRKQRHILITGRNLDSKNIEDFLEELFFKYRAPRSPIINVVLLQPEAPSRDLEMLWRSNKARGNIFFYRGNPLSHHDLFRVNAKNAQVIVLYGDSELGGNEADKEIIYHNLSVKSYCNSVPTFAFIERPENESALLSSCIREAKYDEDEILNQNKGIFIIPKVELKMAIIANSIICKGFCTLLNNILRAELGNLKDFVSNESDEEYYRGSDHEIYCGTLSGFAETSFRKAVKSVFREHNAILIGLLIEKTVVINPEDYVIDGEELGFFLAINSTIPVAINDLRGNSVSLKKPEVASRRRMALKSGVNKFVEKAKEEIERSDVINEFSFLKLVQKKIEILSVDYYVMTNPVNRKRYIEDAATLNDHIIFYGYMKDFHHFVAPLRSKSIEKYSDILIVTHDPLMDDEWEDIFLFPDVFLMTGQFTFRHDMIRANIQNAKHVVISYNYPNSIMSEEMQVRETVLSFLCIKNNFPSTQLTVDLPDEECLRVFHTKGCLDTMLYPEVKTGEVFPRTILDRLMAHGVCNPYIIDVVMNFSFWHIRKEENEERLERSVCLAKIPRKLHDKTFGDVFNYFLKKSKICMGLYRFRFNKQIMEKEEYVYTCPSQDTIVTKDDQAYLLASMTI